MLDTPASELDFLCSSWDSTHPQRSCIKVTGLQLTVLLGGDGTFGESDVLVLSYVTGDMFLKEMSDLSSLSLPAGCHR